MNYGNQPQKFFLALLPIFGIVFGAYLVVGMSLSVVPLFVHNVLGFGTLAVGFVAGSQFTAQLASRVWAGRHADTSGPRHTICIGLVANAAAGMCFLVSQLLSSRSLLAIGMLLIGRAVLGFGTAFLITGAQTMGLAILGVLNTGRLMAWTGVATYAAYLLGAPLGSTLFDHIGFSAVALCTVVVPLLTLALSATMKPVPPNAAQPGSVRSAIAAVWLPGVGMALATVGFAAMMAFAPLLFASRGWVTWTAFAAYAAAFITARVLLGHLPDRAGSAKVALYFALCSTAGQLLLWSSTVFSVALAGATLTGLGQAMIYPALGVEAIRRASPQERGLAVGAFAVFYDISLGIASPLLGLVGSLGGIASVFAMSAVAVLASAAVSMVLAREQISAKPV